MATRSIVLITGANTGLGYEAVKALLQSSKPYHVFLGSRSVDKAKSAIESLQKECPNVSNTVEALQVDLTSDESIVKAFETVKAGPGRVDALVNNAGASFDIEYLRGNVSVRECFNKAYDVNVAGTQVLTHTFIPLLLKSSEPRLIFVSGLSQITQAAERYFPTPDMPAGWPKPKLEFETIGYRSSKCGLNMIMLDWNHKLKADGIKVFGLGPGMLATNLGDVPKDVQEKLGLAHPSAGAAVIQSTVEGARDADTGKIVCKDNGVIPF